MGFKPTFFWVILGCFSACKGTNALGPDAPRSRTPAAREGTSNADLSKQSSSLGSNVGDKTATNAATPPKPIEYPVLTLNGTGQTTCKETMQTTALIETHLSDATLQVKYDDVHVQCYEGGVLGFGACDQADLDQTIKGQVLGTTTYQRSTKAELDKLKAGGFNAATYAIFAKGVTTSQGITYVFDKPLPVFPWPAAATRYEELDKGPKTWLAKATGGPAGSINVAVKVTKVSASGNVVTLRFDLTINAGQNRALYGKFPLPRQAVYKIGTDTQDVRSLHSVSWFLDKNCDSGDVTLDYNLCRKVQGGKTENLGGC